MKPPILQTLLPLLLLLTTTTTLIEAIYPSDHWTYSTKLTTTNFHSTISSSISSGKTVFAPAWNAVTKLFHEKGIENVEFMDVNLSEERIVESLDGEPYNPGMGGWPTIRYFNEETGMKGGDYVKKTEKAMCDELGDEAYLIDYVEEYGNTSTCSVPSGDGCSEREVGYMDKMSKKSVEDQQSQLERLEGMEGASMKPELLAWLKQRKKILRQLVALDGSAEL